MKESIIKFLAENQGVYEKIEKDIWERPETALQEVYASGRQKEYLRGRGFSIREVETVPTAFVAEYGQGKPVVGILGEYDALPDMSQQVCMEKKPAEGQTAGHACGHNLIGTAGLAAVDALREYYERAGLSGTIRYYGCPAEERFSGKLLMEKTGVFDDMDLCLIWHPQDVTGISYKQFYTGLTMIKATFKGETGHSMAAKRLGGNPLQAVNLMITGVNYMREYIWDHHRIHYYIENPGKTANLIPAETSVYFEARSENYDTLKKIKERITEIAEGAAKMSVTTCTVEIEDELYSDLENRVVLDTLLKNMKALPKLAFTEEELNFAQHMAQTLPLGAKKKVADFYAIADEDLTGPLHTGIFVQDNLIYLPADDAGNISRKAPFGTFLVTLPPVGMPMHCWQVTALAGSTIGLKSMMYAAKVMAGTVYDFLTDKNLVEEAAREFEEKIK